MGDHAERSRVIRGALRSSWRTVLVLGLMAFVCVTATVSLVIIGFDDQAHCTTQCGGDGPVSPGGANGNQPEAPTEPDPPVDSDSGGDGSASGAGFGTAAALGAVAALITAFGTATAKVVSALAHLRLASASSDAIRAGHMPPMPSPGLQGEDGMPAGDSV